MTENIRTITPSDIDALKRVLDSCELFPSEFLEGMMAEYLNNPDSQEIWFAYAPGNQPVSIGYCVPEKLTDGTYNLLAIGVAKEYQRQGIARQMMSYIEALLFSRGGRILIVDTSSDDAQSGARMLYSSLGYDEAAVIKDFWKDGEDKIVFRKRLG